QRLLLVKAQRLLDRKARRAERAEIVEKNRHVKMGPPFARAGVLLPGGKRIFKIEKARELAVLFLNRLRQINRLGVAFERVDDRSRHLRHVQGGGFLQLEARYACVDQLLQILGNILVHDGLMANVEHDAEMPAQRTMGLRNRNVSKPRQGLGGGAGIQMPGEIGDRLVGGFKEAIWLRLERKRYGASGLRFERDQVRDHAQDMIGVACHDLAAGDARLKTERSALDRRRNAGGAYIGQPAADVQLVGVE